MSLACREMAAIAGCLVEPGQPPVSVTIHYEYGVAASGQVVLVATRYTDAAGAIVTVPVGAAVIPGACPLVNTDVEFQLLCDTTGTAAAPVHTPFLRRVERAYNGGSGTLITEVITDLAVDAVTPYLVAGTVTASCVDDFEFTEITVCDAAGVAHIRRQTNVNGTMVTLGFFDPTTGAATTPTGAVGPCPVCVPATALGVVASWG